jgi:penicillin-binding protein 2
MFEPEGTIDIFEPDTSRVSVEEVLVDAGVAHVHPMLERQQRNSWALRFLLVAMFLGVVVMIGRVYNLQVVRGAYYRTAAEENRVRLIQKFAPRGLITDRYGTVIARNTPSFEFVVVPHDLPTDEAARMALIAQAAQKLGLQPSDIEAKIKDADAATTQPVSLKQSLSQDEALALEDFAFQNPAFQIQNKPIREYLDAPMYAPFLGYVGKINKDEWLKLNSKGYFLNDTIGKTGIESVYEDILRGINGGTEIEVDATGKTTKQLREIDPQPGQDLKLTIDAGLQKVIYDSLSAMLATKPGSTGAAAIAQDPKTGEILAMVSLPSFDNNLFARGINTTDYSQLANDKNKPLLNRVIGGAYPPGSTVKSVVAAGGLQEGVITDKTIINDEGSISVGPYVFRGWDQSGLGPLNVYQALAMSSDPFFYVVGGGYDPYKIGGLGANKLSGYLKDFGLGAKLGLNLPGEISGTVPTPEWKKQYFTGQDGVWYLGDTYHLAIGQGDLLATPLQVNTYISVFANGGKVMKPILSMNDKPQIESTVPIDQKNIAIVQDGLRQNVTWGTGKRMADLPIPASGKTGSAQFDASGDLHRTHAWYVAYAPSPDPQISITVLVENGGEGGSTALPVVHDAIKWWAENRYNK